MHGKPDYSAEFTEENARRLLKSMTQYKCAMMDIESRFNLLNEEYALEYGRSPINSIKTRLKTLPSIKEKVQRKGYDFTPESINENIDDIAGVRVTCAFAGDVYALADALLRQDDICLVEEKDYIQNPKENGYRSLHLVVSVPVFLSDRTVPTPVEIQIRTMAMDFWASLEHHLRYKTQNNIDEDASAR